MTDAGWKPPKLDEIGPWSEVKLEIIRKYASAYSRILARQQKPSFEHVYIDGFSGAGEHISRDTGNLVPGSPLNALQVEPPFVEYFLVDLDGTKVAHLRTIIGDRPDVHVLQGDCSRVLLAEVFPSVRYERYRRGLCLLDPYGLHLDWQVIAVAAKMRSIELFLNFPTMDINLNILGHEPAAVAPEHRKRMTRYWGDQSWMTELYSPAHQLNLFGDPEVEKRRDDAVAAIFGDRLRKVAGFNHVPAPLPMRNTKNSVVYYLFFAAHKPVAQDIVEEIFDKYR
jgi:three-Cys-motif partner protein